MVTTEGPLQRQCEVGVPHYLDTQGRQLGEAPSPPHPWRSIGQLGVLRPQTQTHCLDTWTYEAFQSHKITTKSSQEGIVVESGKLEATATGELVQGREVQFLQ